MSSEVTWKTGCFRLGPVIAADAACKEKAAQLVEMLRPATGIDIQIVLLDAGVGSKPSIVLKVDPAMAVSGNNVVTQSIRNVRDAHGPKQ
jgi:hypothetical protein